MLGLSIVVAACGSSSKPATPSTTSATSATTTTFPQAALSIAVWPTVASGDRYNAPLAVARALLLTTCTSSTRLSVSSNKATPGRVRFRSGRRQRAR